VAEWQKKFSIVGRCVGQGGDMGGMVKKRPKDGECTRLNTKKQKKMPCMEVGGWEGAGGGNR